MYLHHFLFYLVLLISSTKGLTNTIPSFVLDDESELLSEEIAAFKADAIAFEYNLELGDSITKIVVQNEDPEAKIFSSAISGEVPLAVIFDGLASFDKDGDPLSYEWFLDGVIFDAGEISKMTFRDSGEYEITLEVSDGKEGIASDSITITVNESNIPVTDIFIDPSDDDINVNDNRQFTFDIEPDNATNQTVTWMSSNESIATINSNGLLSAIAPGKVEITIISNDNAKAFSIADIPVLMPSTSSVRSIEIEESPSGTSSSNPTFEAVDDPVWTPLSSSVRNIEIEERSSETSSSNPTFDLEDELTSDKISDREYNFTRFLTDEFLNEVSSEVKIFVDRIQAKLIIPEETSTLAPE